MSLVATIFFILLQELVFYNCKEFIRDKRDLAKADDPLISTNLFEGDIAGIDGKALTRVADGENVWLNREIPYIINQLSHTASRAINKAIDEFERKTCIRFKNATEYDRDYLVFVSGDGCYSYIGKHGGRQEVSVEKNCETVGTVLHLLMHALGYWHEQSRLDRDSYVLINLDNVAPENKKHFEKYAVKLDIYDYNSITHMSPYAFAIDKSKKTILAKDERFRIGQRLELSQGDVNAVVKRYCGRRSSDRSEQEILQNKRHEEEVHRETFADFTDAENGASDETQTEGCRDLETKCPLWATQGMCYKQRHAMITNCPASCLACDQPKKCLNFNSLCGMWAWMGHCLGNRAVEILRTCPLACGVCLPEGTIDTHGNTTLQCQDKHPRCPALALKGRCFYQHVIRLCPASCDRCLSHSTSHSDITRCEDRHQKCHQWKERGYCTQDEYKQKCPKSCLICTQHSPAPGGRPCRDYNPVLCKYLKNASNLACLLEITAKSCPKTCGTCT